MFGCPAPCGCGAEYIATCEGGCDSGCTSGKGGCGLAAGFGGCECDLGDPYELFGEYKGFSMGGWTQIGYFDKALPLFNSRADNVQLQQQWLFAEKAIDTSNGYDIGGRIDYIYGTDGPDTQAFGIDNNHWDNGWDNGNDYGHAIPQLYVEAGYGDMSVKLGHFYTIIGWEVVTAPDNFFYSHAYTMYNSEPFTHTGALATYTPGDEVTVYGGYVLGWDSGFEDNGDAFLGGISMDVTDRLNMTYATVGGRFGETRGISSPSERGYMHSVVGSYSLSDKLTYIGQSDFLTAEGPDGAKSRETVGYNNYLIYQHNDCWGFGGRFEWYQNQGIYTDPPQKSDIYALTFGLNYKPHANVLVRPEVRWDWVSNTAAIAAAGNSVLENNDDDQTTFGIDTIFLF